MNLGQVLEGQPVPTEMCDVYFTAESLSHLVAKDNIQEIVDYIARLPKSLEIYTLIAILRETQDTDVFCSIGIRRWASANVEYLGVRSQEASEKSYKKYLEDNHLCAEKREVK